MTTKSVSATAYDKVQANRREGRACSGPSRSRIGCSGRATHLRTDEVYLHVLNEGPAEVLDMPLCKRHAGQSRVGATGVNFRVLALAAIAQ